MESYTVKLVDDGRPVATYAASTLAEAWMIAGGLGDSGSTQIWCGEHQISE